MMFRLRLLTSFAVSIHKWRKSEAQQTRAILFGLFRFALVTWIVGVPSPFGHAMLVSDVCVTFPGRRDRETKYVDCLQKVYPLARFVLGGFSGSVRIGFEMLGQFSKRLNKLSAQNGVDIDVAANIWLPRMARHIFGSSDEREKVLGCSIILAWVHPTRDRPALSSPWSYVHVFSSPRFSPSKAAEVGALSIGSGARVSEYVNTVMEICQEHQFLRWSLERDKMDATFLSAVLRDRLEKSPSPGISHFFQMAVVTRGPWSIGNNERLAVLPDGTKMEEQFPPIARSYGEFVKICKSRGLAAAAAST